MLTADRLRQARWFGGKSRAISDTREVDRANLTDRAQLSLVEVHYGDGPSETYVMVDHLDDPDVGRAILHRFNGITLPTDRGGQLRFRATHVFHSTPPDRLQLVKPLRGEQSNTSILFGDALILKLFRRLQYGPNPDVEIGWFLTEHTDFPGTPPVAGSLTYVSPSGDEAALALLQQFEPNRGDAWTTTLRRLACVFDGAGMTESIDAARRLGATTAELHLALASGTGDFGAEPITRHDVEQWLSSLESELHEVVGALQRQHVTLDTSSLDSRAQGLAVLTGALKARHHGDYHLGQVLERDDGAFVIIDFEGEPSRPLSQRREKRTPLRDVAGMLRSFDYARHVALRATNNPSERDRVELSSRWYATVREVFLTEYLSVARHHPKLMPNDIGAPLAALELEKAAYEVMYELNNRPDWLPIPLAAFSLTEWRR